MLVEVLMHQGRFEEVEENIVVSGAECKIVNDSFFSRLYNEITALILVRKGEIKKGLELAEQVRAHARKHSQKDF
jgi:hypothetical protein